MLQAVIASQYFKVESSVQRHKKYAESAVNSTSSIYMRASCAYQIYMGDARVNNAAIQPVASPNIRRANRNVAGTSKMPGTSERKRSENSPEPAAPIQKCSK